MKSFTKALDILKEAVDARRIPGANVLVFKNGKEVCYLEDGYADIENEIPIERDTIFRLFSMTKPITGAAAMILFQNGQIDLHEPISNYLEGFSHQVVTGQDILEQVKQEATIFNLLSMTSGLQYDIPEVAAVFDEAILKGLSTIEVAERLGRCPLAFHPGERFRYGTSADVMGAVIEAASGERFGQFLRDQIFSPLDMPDTRFYVPRKKQDRLAKTYEETGSDMIEDTNAYLGISPRLEDPPTYELGGAGLASTVDDYMNFAQMLLNEGSWQGKRILEKKICRKFTSSQITEAMEKDLEDAWGGLYAGFGYGNYLRIMKNPGRSPFLTSKGEYGWDGLLGVHFANFPKEKISFVFMTQRSASGTLAVTRKVRNAILAAL